MVASDIHQFQAPETDVSHARFAILQRKFEEQLRKFIKVRRTKRDVVTTEKKGSKNAGGSAAYLICLVRCLRFAGLRWWYGRCADRRLVAS